MPSSPRRDDRGAGRLVLMAAASAVVAALLALRLTALAGLPSGRGASALPSLPVEGLIEAGALGIGLLAATWLALSAGVAVACVAAHRLGGRWRAGEAVLERVAPAVVRRLARSAVGLGVGTGLALAPSAALAVEDGAAARDAASSVVASTTVVDLGWQPTSGAAAEPTPATGTGAGADDGAEVADGGREAATAVPADGGDGDLADLAITGAAADAGDGPRGDVDRAPGIRPAHDGGASVVSRDLRGMQPADDGTVVVLRGDTLWDIAATHLAAHGTPAPSDAQVLEEMTRWHQANRDVVGTDPDVILPGQVLRPPG